jgi:glutathione S-transferase
MTMLRAEEELMGELFPLAMQVLHTPADERDWAFVAAKTEAFYAALPAWDARLRDRTWLVGDAFTLADITLYTPIADSKPVTGRDVPGELGHLRAWLARIGERPTSPLVLSAPAA